MERAEHAEPLNASGMVATHSGGAVAPHDADEALEMSGSSPGVGDHDEPDFLWRTNGECDLFSVLTKGPDFPWRMGDARILTFHWCLDAFWCLQSG
jgi:hypothetical protein